MTIFSFLNSLKEILTQPLADTLTQLMLLPTFISVAILISLVIGTHHISSLSFSYIRAIKNNRHLFRFLKKRIGNASAIKDDWIEIIASCKKMFRFVFNLVKKITVKAISLYKNRQESSKATFLDVRYVATKTE